LSVAIKDVFCATTQKVKNVVISLTGQTVIGFGLGIAVPVVCMPLTRKMLTVLGVLNNLPHPFMRISLIRKILATPGVCVLLPIWEERVFRGTLQDKLKNGFTSFYTKLGFSSSVVNIISRVNSVFFAAVIFGVMHFSNAIFAWSNPFIFLPQVVYATIVGFFLGLLSASAQSLITQKSLCRVSIYL
jgi:membrane protease YdiL (CAAX protease family)